MTTSTRTHLASTVLGVAVFVLYLATLSPSVAMWDAGEYIAAAFDMGIPHQPGNPFFLVVAHVAGLLPLSDTYAVRINVLAAFSSAVSAALWFLCAERLLRTFIEQYWHRLAAASGAALLGAAAWTVWNQSVVMEKVYPLALIGLSLTSLLLIIWLDTAKTDDRRADRLLVLIAYLVGLTYAIHPAGLLTGPAALLAVVVHRPAMLKRWRLGLIGALAFFLGTTPFAVLPIRAAHQPYVNESAISACEDGTIAASCTFSLETARRLKAAIDRDQYGGNAVLKRRGPITAQVGMFWLYFKWQWIRDLGKEFPGAQTFAALVMLALGIGGLHAMRRSPHFWYFGALAGTFTIALIVYLNFRYGWSQSPELGDLVAREPRDRDYFYMWTFSLWGLLAGVGLAHVTRQLRPRLATLAIAAVAFVPLVSNYTAASRTGQGFTAAFARDMLTSLEPNAIIVTNGDNDSFPLWYAQAVEGLRPDVTVVLSPYLGMAWYTRQMNRRSDLWNLTDGELDSIPDYVELTAPAKFDLGAMTASFEPGYLMRDQILVMRSIRDTFPARPVYFASGQYASAMGLGAHLKRVGLVTKLMPTPVVEDPDTVKIGTQFFGISESLAAWNQYGGAKQFLAEGRWVDSGSAVIPLFYAAAGQGLAIALEARGRAAEAQEIMTVVEQVAAIAQPAMVR
jgi:hypothetical protein